MTLLKLAWKHSKFPRRPRVGGVNLETANEPQRHKGMIPIAFIYLEHYLDAFTCRVRLQNALHQL